jgi:predicted metalloprotease
VVGSSQPGDRTQVVGSSQPGDRTQVVGGNQPGDRTQVGGGPQPGDRTQVVGGTQPGDRTQVVGGTQPGDRTQVVGGTQPGDRTQVGGGTQPGDRTQVEDTPPGDRTQVVGSNQPGDRTQVVPPGSNRGTPPGPSPAGPTQSANPAAGPTRAVNPAAGPTQAVNPAVGPTQAVNPAAGPTQAVNPAAGPTQAVNPNLGGPTRQMPPQAPNQPAAQPPWQPAPQPPQQRPYTGPAPAQNYGGGYPTGPQPTVGPPSAPLSAPYGTPTQFNTPGYTRAYTGPYAGGYPQSGAMPRPMVGPPTGTFGPPTGAWGTPPPPPPPSWGTPPPPYYPVGSASRSSHTGAIVGICLFVVALLGIGTFAVVGISHARSVAESGYSLNTGGSGPGASSSVEPTPDSAGPSSSSSPSSQEFPPSSASGAPSTEPGASGSSSPGTSTNGPQPVLKLADNPLFVDDKPLTKVDCQLSTWHTDPASALKFYQSALVCLNNAWDPVLEADDLPVSAPQIQAPATGGGTSPCASGSEAFAAYYCGENDTIYMPYQTLQVDQFGNHPGVYLAVLAHEYGHHVQHLAGVMDAEGQEAYDATSDDAALELSRRLELQAQCFSGMFLAATVGQGSVDQNIYTEAAQTQDRGDDNDPGGPRTHGTNAHTSGWWLQGAQKDSTAQCNTWAASSADVA